jgi:uncharacterized membrane protein
MIDNTSFGSNWQQDLLRIALFVAGVVVLVICLPGLITAIAALSAVSSMYGMGAGSQGMRIPGMGGQMGWMVLGPVLQVIGALFLIFGSNMIARALYPDRYRGGPSDSQAP